MRRIIIAALLIFLPVTAYAQGINNPCKFGTTIGTCAQGGVVTAGGPTGSSTTVPIITYNAAGQITAVSSATIAPAFNGLSVNLSSNQSITDATPTAILFDTTVLDTQSAYAAGSGKWTPTVAGKYLVIVTAELGVTAVLSAASAYVYKNGSPLKEADAGNIPINTSVSASAVASMIVSMNGTTDYIQGFATANGTGGGDKVFGSHVLTTMEITFIGP